MANDDHIWSASDVLAGAGAGLSREAAALEREQAVRGLDALSEVQLHPLLAAGLRDAGLGVLREQPYPGIVKGPLKRSERSRCDLVLLPRAGLKLRDPVDELVAADATAGTLFAGLHEPPPPDTLSSRDAYWLEVKSVGQHTYTGGVPGPNSSYSGEITRAYADDLAKLAQEAHIVRGGLMVILFTADAATASHDLGIALARAMDKGLPLRSPDTTQFEIADRIGNRWCTVSLIEVSPVR
ncbi:MAG: hypothetical protein WC718_04890 [Phycisphaerales bacterium]|jgi:hypothetical protein